MSRITRLNDGVVKDASANTDAELLTIESCAEDNPTQIFFTGPPGSGKTNLAELVAGILGWDLCPGYAAHSPRALREIQDGDPKLSDAYRNYWLAKVKAAAAVMERIRSPLNERVLPADCPVFHRPQLETNRIWTALLLKEAWRRQIVERGKAFDDGKRRRWWIVWVNTSEAFANAQMEARKAAGEKSLSKTKLRPFFKVAEIPRPCSESGTPNQLFSRSDEEGVVIVNGEHKHLGLVARAIINKVPGLSIHSRE